MELLSYIFFLEGSFAHHRNFCRGLNSPINLSENRSNRTVNIVLQNIIWSKELSRGARYRSNNAFRSIYLVSKLKFRNVILWTVYITKHEISRLFSGKRILCLTRKITCYTGYDNMLYTLHLRGERNNITINVAKIYLCREFRLPFSVFRNTYSWERYLKISIIIFPWKFEFIITDLPPFFLFYTRTNRSE